MSGWKHKNRHSTTERKINKPTVNDAITGFGGLSKRAAPPPLLLFRKICDKFVVTLEGVFKHVFKVVPMAFLALSDKKDIHQVGEIVDVLLPKFCKMT